MTKFKAPFFKINQKLFPFLFTLTYAFLVIESATYIGFIRRFTLIDSRYFLVITLISFLFYRLYSVREKIKLSLFTIFLLRLNKLVFPLAAIIYLILQTLEAQHFKNYVFSTYHLQPDNFFNIVLFGLIIFLIEKLSDNDVVNISNVSIFEKSPGTNSKGILRFFITLCIFILFGGYLLKNTNLTVNTAAGSNLFILSHLNYSYDQKMTKIWGFYYDYMVFVRDNTPQDAKILIPPQEGPWFSEGNEALSRYFLYPRKLYNGKDISLDASGVDYIMIAWGSWTNYPESAYGWPKQSVKAKELIYLNPKDNTTRIFFENYNPKDHKNIGGWGLIKTK